MHTEVVALFNRICTKGNLVNYCFYDQDEAVSCLILVKPCSKVEANFVSLNRTNKAFTYGAVNCQVFEPR